MLAAHRVPGVQVAVIDGGAVTWLGSYGLAERQPSRAVTDGTLFNVGSVSKTVAAWGVMTMLEDSIGPGLDSPVAGYLSRWQLPDSRDFDANQLTVRRLLTHTSGLSILPASESFDYPPSLEETLSRSYGSFGRVRLVREPGTTFQYNNGNYVVLQLLIEEVTGTAFATYMKRTVLEPLEMGSSTYAFDPRRLAVPYDSTGQPLPYYATYRNESFAASGGLYTTAGDLARFVAATMSGPDGSLPGRSVLSPSTVRLMVSPAAEAHGNYGIGYKMLPVSGTLTMIGHDGANPGWRATFLAVPEKGVGIVILANSRSGGAIVADIVCAWADWEVDIELTGLCEGATPVPSR
ncbi:MAG: beta-lactamase family protein [Gemmatimonadetes bacterium]|uniref:Beta-lactamase family protein n=1 Tax=Candidatus Kutchimonas denitrificans TaxID=3056748 RepID=A0AAE4ZDI5_9BACT|nr:beta-lactamase family protein [Gemmatimonadota bacterium]NIR76450.1 beta-lactamase family protein [Candidatus Kutchimonas denitrificans]NIS03268.1 beta-lactamase family protein [Gemmatimonadota bacterium]NIT69129.1 beta-lactamase family protein [Gemmatimonadota bacterium]NIU54521.1 serine hydrolase [Gemmatimonadota bacterium]